MSDQFKFVQNQPTTLAGAGTSLGDTSVILSALTQIDGTVLTMTDFGSIGFGTIEPGNGTQEEQISFTGVTQNSNGTATLTGVSTVLTVSPYTQTSGLATSHPGGAQFVISNTAGFYDKLTSKSDDETITGLWDFPSGANNPTIGNVTYVAPTGSTQIATKGYVDSVAFSGAPDASTTVKGIVQLPTQAQVDARTSAGSTAALLAVTPTTLRSTLLSDIATDTGAASAYVIAPSPAISAYGTGQTFSFIAGAASTGASTLNVNSLGTRSIFKLNGTTALLSGDIALGEIARVQYNGSAFQLINPSAKDFVDLTTSQSITSGTKTFTVLPQSSAVPSSNSDLTNVAYIVTKTSWTTGVGSSAINTDHTTTITHGLGRTPQSVRINTNIVPSDLKGANRSSSQGFYNGTTQNCVYFITDGSNVLAGTNGTNAIYIQPAASVPVSGLLAVTSTNITIAWTQTGNPGGTAYFEWEAN